MKFRRVSITNYRSIKSADLKLGIITAIVGESDVGKTNVVRAIRDWNNGNLGQDCVSADAKMCSVRVCVGANASVTLERNKTRSKGSERSSATRYVIEDIDAGDVIHIEKFGSSTPQQVREVTGLKPFRLADDRVVDINISQQGDPWFMLSRPLWTDLPVARLIAKVCGIDALMRAIKARKKEAARAAGEAKVVKGRIDELKAFINGDSKAVTKEATKKLDEFDSLIEQRNRTNEKLENAMSLMSKIRRLADRVSATDEFLDIVSMVDFSGADVYFKKKGRLEEALSILKEISRIRKAIVDTSECLDDVETSIKVQRDMFIAEIESGSVVCPLCGDAAHDDCIEGLRGRYA